MLVVKFADFFSFFFPKSNYFIQRNWLDTFKKKDRQRKKRLLKSVSIYYQKANLEKLCNFFFLFLFFCWLNSSKDSFLARCFQWFIQSIWYIFFNFDVFLEIQKSTKICCKSCSNWPLELWELNLITMFALWLLLIILILFAVTFCFNTRNILS